MCFSPVFSLFDIIYGLGRRDPILRSHIVHRCLHPLCIVFREQSQVLITHSDFCPNTLVQHWVTVFSKSATGKTHVSFNIWPVYVTFTVRGIIGTEELTFRGWVTDKRTISHGRLANANKAAAPRTGARGSGAGAQKLHHARRVAAAERRASVPTES